MVRLLLLTVGVEFHCINHYLFLLLCSVSLYDYYTFFFYSFISWWRSCVFSSFVLLWIYTNLFVDIYLCFSWSISRTRISGLQGRYIFSFIRKQKIYQSDYNTYLPTLYKYSSFSHFLHIWYIPSQRFCTSRTLCQAYCYLRYLCGLFTHIL